MPYYTEKQPVQASRLYPWRKMIRVTLRDPALWGPLWVLRRLRFPVMVVRGLGVGTMT